MIGEEYQYVDEFMIERIFWIEEETVSIMDLVLLFTMNRLVYEIISR